MKAFKRLLGIVMALAMTLPLLFCGTTASYADGVFAFDSAEFVSSYTSLAHSVEYSYDSGENALMLKATGGDPYILLDVSAITNIYASSNKGVAIVYKALNTNSSAANMGELFLSAGSVAGPTAGYSTMFNINANSSYIVQTIDLSSTSWWTGKINNIRIDPFCSNNAGDTMYVDSIIVAANAKAAAELGQARVAERLTGGEDLGDLVCTSYEYDKYTSPLWKGNIVYNEAVFPEADPDGNLTFTLMYEPDEITSVYNATFSARYEEGVDFTVEGNKLTLLKSGNVNFFDYTYIHPQSNPNNYDWYTYYQRHAAGDGKWELNFQGIFLTGYLNVTYTHSDTWDYYAPESKEELLPKTADRIRNNELYNVVFFGDSICGGANASEYRDLYPYAPSWTSQITTRLKKTYGCSNLKEHIISVGGSDASGMVENIGQVTACDPDLVFIEFGVNDGMNVSSSHPDVGEVASDYKDAIETMITKVKASNPDCEIVLVSPFYPNIYCHYMEYFEAFEESLMELESEYEGVAVADVTALMRDLLDFKTYTCFNGDNQCHPNDFGMRLYSQTCLATIIPEDLGFDAFVPEELQKVSIDALSSLKETINETGAATFTVTAYGNGLVYEWATEDTLPQGAQVYGTSSKSLSVVVLEALSEDFSASFTCTVTDKFGNTVVSPAVTVEYVAPNNAIMGDANSDGQVTPADALLLRKYLVRSVSAEEINMDAVDMNADGKVNAMDVYLIRKLLAE